MDKHGVRFEPDAVEAVSKRKAPRTDTQSMSFVGFANYYTESEKEYADKVECKWKKLECNEKSQAVFENKKREISGAPKYRAFLQRS